MRMFINFVFVSVSTTEALLIILQAMSPMSVTPALTHTVSWLTCLSELHTTSTGSSSRCSLLFAVVGTCWVSGLVSFWTLAAVAQDPKKWCQCGLIWSSCHFLSRSRCLKLKLIACVVWNNGTTWFGSKMGIAGIAGTSRDHKMTNWLSPGGTENVPTSVRLTGLILALSNGLWLRLVEGHTETMSICRTVLNAKTWSIELNSPSRLDKKPSLCTASSKLLLAAAEPWVLNRLCHNTSSGICNWVDVLAMCGCEL